MTRRLSLVFGVLLILGLVGCDQTGTTTTPTSVRTEQTPTATAKAPASAIAPTAAKTQPATTAMGTAVTKSQTPADADPFAFFLRYLTAADVEKVSGIPGIKLVPRDSAKGAAGYLNFGKPDGTLVLLATFGSGADYQKAKDTKGYFTASVSGVGDEAFVGPEQSPSGEPYVIVVKKGDHTVSLSSFMDTSAGMKNVLDQGMLIELARIVIARF